MNSICIYNIVFINDSGENIVLHFKGETKIKEIINEYFKRMKKKNLSINNIENTHFIYNGQSLMDYNEKPINSICSYQSDITIFVSNGLKNNQQNYEIVETIKENVFTSVFKAKIKDKHLILKNTNLISLGISPGPLKSEKGYVAIKKIYKDKIKEEMKFSLMKENITEEDFKPEIEKFNKELQNMKICHCPYSVEIYDFYDTDKEFIIIMELCDDTLLNILCRNPNGFSSKEIKEVFLQLNIVFKIMYSHNISHRDIKLNNILVKYLNEEKTQYKVLLSDYGVSNQLYSLTQKFNTHAGSQVIMAPEILNDDDYTNKCDLWSIGVIIFQLKTKSFPYKGNVEKAILREIKNKGLSILNIIDDNEKDLKDLLSRLLVSDPNKRISWDDYFNHQFFK